MTRQWLFMRPLDAVTVRDGRPFEAGAAGVAEAVFPRPYTFAGACRAAFGDEPAKVAGPLRYKSGFRFPMPLDLSKPIGGSDAYTRLRPEAPKGGVRTDLDMPMVIAGEDDPPESGLLHALQMEAYVNGAEVTEATVDDVAVERRAGLTRKDRAGVDGLLYSNEFWRLRDDGSPEGFAGYVDDAPHWLRENQVVPFGGESRLVEVSPLDETRLPTPDGPLGDRLVVYLATPAVFRNGWEFPLSADSGGTVVAAATGRPEPISGWGRQRNGQGKLTSSREIVGRPRPLMWAVPAGSVYYLKFDTAEQAQFFARRNHGKCLTQHGKRLRTAGFGLCLIGRWQ